MKNEIALALEPWVLKISSLTERARERDYIHERDKWEALTVQWSLMNDKTIILSAVSTIRRRIMHFN